MTPKEKAKELYDKYYEFVYIQHYYTSKYEVTQCALIAVNEMLDFNNMLIYTEDSMAHKYWLEVKSEIEKL